MELNAFWGSLVRRWYLVLGAVALSVVAVVLSMARSAPTYQAEGVVLVFPPTQTTVVDGEPQTPGNPFLELGGLAPIRDLLIRTMTATTFQMEMAEKHPTAGYQVASDFTTDGPLLVIQVTAPSNDEAISTLNDSTGSVPRLIKELQAGKNFPKRAPRVTSMEVTKDTVAAPDTSGEVRSGIMAGAGVFTVLLLGIGLTDGLLRRRREALAKEDDESEEPEQLPNPFDPADRDGSVELIHMPRAERPIRTVRDG